jgi:hypothetical protein
VSRPNAQGMAWSLSLAAALTGCGGTIKQAGYPADWPARVATLAHAECPDLSGTYQAGDGERLLPFFLFGLADRTSTEWTDLVQVAERLLADPEGATVTVGHPDPDHIEVAVAQRGTPLARQVLTRSRRSATTAEVWFGQAERSFRCEPNAIVVVGSLVHDWDQYRLPAAEKKRRYPRPGGIAVGTSSGYFDFSKTTDGGLVMLQRLYHCYGECSLDHRWRRWEPARGATAN